MQRMIATTSNWFTPQIMVAFVIFGKLTKNEDPKCDKFSFPNLLKLQTDLIMLQI